MNIQKLFLLFPPAQMIFLKTPPNFLIGKTCEYYVSLFIAGKMSNYIKAAGSNQQVIPVKY
jgi:hypothetical protein